MKTKCPECRQKYELDGEYDGETVECLQCGEKFVVKEFGSPILKPIPDKLANQKNSKLIECSICGEKIAESAAYCPHCGAVINKKMTKASGAINLNDPIHIVGIILAILIIVGIIAAFIIRILMLR